MNRSDTLGTSSLGRPLRTRLTIAALMALSLAVAVTPGVRGRLVSALSRAHRGTSLPGPRFSDPPTDDEFLRTGLFAQPLIPVGPTNRHENTELAALLVAYSEALLQGEPDAVQPLADFAAQHPHSVWTPGLELDLGAVYRRTGHFSKALTTWQSAWDASKNLTSPDGRIVGDMAAAYLSQFEAYLGRKEMLAPLLEDLKDRSVRGTAAELVSESSRGMAEMEFRPDVSFKCGPSALSRILGQTPTPDVATSRRVLNEAKSTPNGLSLSAVQAISVEAGMNYQMAYRSPGASVLIPAVAHWKVGHYAAVLGRDARERLLVGDATFGEDIALTSATFDEETSGYFLVPPGPLPDGWRRVAADEGRTVWGRGNTGNNHDNGATGRDEKQAFGCGPGGGCTRWNVEAAVAGLELRDDPVGYTPPFGPEIRFPMTYSHRDVQQPAKFTYTNFGNKWTFGWLSYIVDNAPKFEGGAIYPWGYINGAPAFQTFPAPSIHLCADLYRRGGGDEPYVFPTAAPDVPIFATTTSAEGQFSQAYLTRYVDANGYASSFTRTLPDGSVEKFTLRQGTKFFMTEVDDPQGNAVKINYDPQTTRITSIVDALGQATTICYNDSPAPCGKLAASINPPSNNQVTQIIDPFGRYAVFGYDPQTGHLTSIMDVLGIASLFQYNTSGNADFVNTLTTPYGTTTFAFTDPSYPPTVTSFRTITATEVSALGTLPPRTSRVESRQGNDTCDLRTPTPAGFPDGSLFDANGIECRDGDIHNGNSPPESLYNGLLQYRNTFIWNPQQYAEKFGTSERYLGAKNIHWAHTDYNGDSNLLTSSRVPESIKEPLENRTWFTYPGQSVNRFPATIGQSSIGVGATNQPSAIVRAGGGPDKHDGDGTFQHWRFQYDAYGHVTQSIDPAGRTLSMTYDPTNNVDLLTVRNITRGRNDLLLTLSNYIQHRPQQVAGANGQTTQLRYNASGQLVSSTDPLNNTWLYSYVPTTGGFLTGVVGPAVPVPASQGGGQQTPTYAFTYDNVGRLWTEEGPDKQMLTLSYDNADRLTKTLFPDLTTELRGYTFEAPSQLAGRQSLDLMSFTDRQGFVTTRQYDGFRDLIEIDESVDPITKLARITKLSYRPDGTVQTVTDPLNHITKYTRDVQGRVHTVTNQDNSTEWYGYDLLGRVLSTSPDQFATMPGTKQYAYNHDDTISQAFLDSRAPTVFAYDPAYPRPSGWSRVQGGTWAQPTCASGSCPVLDQEGYTYYPVGTVGANRVNQVVTTIAAPSLGIAPMTVTSTYAYDPLDRVSGKQISTSPLASQSVNAAESFHFDAIGRLTNDANLLDSFTYTYNDATARIHGRTSAGGPQIAASYYPPQQDGLLQQLSYTSVLPEGSALLAQYTYGYDTRHNVTSFSDSNRGASSYTYDAYSQLSTADFPNRYSHTSVSAVPDSSGNIASLQTAVSTRTFSTSVLVAFASDAANKLTQETTTRIYQGSSSSSSTVVQPISCDGSVGSLETIGSGATEQGYQYDSSNRLSSYTVGTAVPYVNSSGFLYDGLGRLSQVVDYVTATGSTLSTPVANHSYAWCGQRMCLEIDNMQQRAISGSGQTTGLVDALYVAQGTVNNPTTATAVGRSQLAYDITDLLGSERAVVTGNAIVALYDYDTFGSRKVVSGNAAASNRGFTGFYYHAASGLQFARNRVYNASLGRWMTRDPIGIGHAFDDPERFNATDLNLYAYAGNNPQSMVDPSGYCGGKWAIEGHVGAAALAGFWFGLGGEVNVGIMIGPGVHHYVTFFGEAGGALPVTPTPVVGAYAGFGAGGGFVADVSANEGAGGSIGVNTPVGSVAVGVSNGSFTSGSVTVGPGAGGDIHGFGTYTGYTW